MHYKIQNNFTNRNTEKFDTLCPGVVFADQLFPSICNNVYMKITMQDGVSANAVNLSDGSLVTLDGDMDCAVYVGEINFKNDLFGSPDDIDKKIQDANDKAESDYITYLNSLQNQFSSYITV